MLTLALALAAALAQPTRLDAWRWQIEAMDWTWRETSPDRSVQVFTRPVSPNGKDAPVRQLWVRIERFEGPWQSAMAKVAVDCRAGQALVVEAEAFGGMNLSGEVKNGDVSGWTASTPVLRPILRGACGS